MVLRKPYAFLIKHFKLIHIILCLPLIYLLVRTGSLSTFLNGYVRSNYFTNEHNVSGIYINYFMYLSVFLVIGIAFVVYFLMRQKKKTTRFYMFLIIFYLIYLVFITLTHNALSGIEDASATAQSIRAFRDITLLFYLPQFYFVGFSLLRGIGFDIKKFNFEADAKELEISDLDSEEFELVLGANAYKYKRTFRRYMREFRYYVLENRFTFTIIVCIGVSVLGVLLYLHFGVYNRTYKQTQSLSHNNLFITVENSLLTNLDIGGKVIDGKYYLAIGYRITNNGFKSVPLDYENFVVEIENHRIKPVLDRSSYFPDLGVNYTRDTLIPEGVEAVYVFTYPIDESLLDKNMQLKILDAVTYEIGSITPIYKTVHLSYDKVFESTYAKKIPFGQYLVLDNTVFGMTQVRVNKILVDSKYVYNYKKCISASVCQDLKGIVAASPNKTLIVLDRVFVPDLYSSYFVNRHGTDSFVSDLFTLKYKIKNEEYTSSIKDVTSKELDGTWIFEVNKNVESADEISLMVTVRGSVYEMVLKSKENG